MNLHTLLQDLGISVRYAIYIEQIKTHLNDENPTQIMLLIKLLAN